MARRKFYDTKYSEVEVITMYAVHMGNLSMALRGLSILVFTWTTVVLLGGFVSDLEKKDFWSLTFITISQPAGVFDSLQDKMLDGTGRIEDVWDAFLATLSRIKSGVSIPGQVSALVLALVQLLVSCIILLPLVFIYGVGLFFSAGISIWRLIQHDYRDPNASANMVPALDVLYYLAAAQGLLFAYRTICVVDAPFRLVKVVADHYFLDRNLDGLIYYIRYIMQGCEKDPSFASGRNLITCAASWFNSEESPHAQLMGAKILSALVQVEGHDDSESRRAQKSQITRLLVESATSGDMQRKLMWALDLSGPSKYDRDMRVQAAGIMVFTVRHMEFDPDSNWTRYVLSPLKLRLEDLAEADRELVYHGLGILEGIMLKNDEIVDEHIKHLPMIDHSDQAQSQPEDSPVATGVINFVRSVCSRVSELHRCRLKSVESCGSAPDSDHGPWTLRTMEKSLRLTRELHLDVTGAGLRAPDAILNCPKCPANLKSEAVRLIGYLAEQDNREDPKFIRMLLRRFTDGNTEVAIRRPAGEVLASLGSSPMLDACISVADGNVADSLTKIVVEPGDSRCRRMAAEILKNLLTTPDGNSEHDDFKMKLKKSLTDMMPKIVGEFMGCGPATAEQVQGTDIEEGQRYGGVAQDDVPKHKNILSSPDRRETDEGHHEGKLHESMLSLCFQFCRTFEHQLDAAVPGGAFSLLKRIREIHDTVGESLIMVKLAVELVTPILEQGGSCPTFDMKNFIEWLSTTSEVTSDESYLTYNVVKARDLLYGTREAQERSWWFMGGC